MILKPQAWFLTEDHQLIRKYLESPSGEQWSSTYHKTTGNQTDLLSLKDCDEYSEKKQWMWRCSANAYSSVC